MRRAGTENGTREILASPQNKQCTGPPAAPGTGTTPKQLAAQANVNASKAAQHAYNLFWFKSKAQNKGPWDYKQYSRGNPTDYQNFGNYNYGHTGVAAGIPKGILLRQAGKAQQAAGTSQPGWGNPGIDGIFGGTPPYGDDPADQVMIERESMTERTGAEMARIAKMVATVVTSMLAASCSGRNPYFKNEALGSAMSPDHKLQAVVFSRNCGATTGDNIQVSILPSGTAPEGKGNALIMDQAPPYSSAYSPVWQLDGTAMLMVPHGARVFAKNALVGSTRVTFKEM